MINKLADLIEQHADEFAALETLNVGRLRFIYSMQWWPLIAVFPGKVFSKVQWVDVGGTVACLRYYAGWADKITGKTIEVGGFGVSRAIVSNTYAVERRKDGLHKAWTIRCRRTSSYSQIIAATNSHDQGHIIPWNFPCTSIFVGAGVYWHTGFMHTQCGCFRGRSVPRLLRETPSFSSHRSSHHSVLWNLRRSSTKLDFPLVYWIL